MPFPQRTTTPKPDERMEPDKPMPFDARASFRRARAAQAPPRAWAQQFYEQAEHTGLPLATLNAIVAESGALAEADAALARRLAAGEGRAGLRKPAQAEAASQIGAAHAKAHGRRGPASR